MKGNDTSGPKPAAAPKKPQGNRVSFRTVIIDMLRRQWWPRVAISGTALVLVASAIGSYFRVTQKPQVSTPPSGEAVFIDVSVSVFALGTIRETRLLLPDESEFGVQIYDFDSYYYQQGENDVTSEPLISTLLLTHRKDFAEAWVVIFAGASFEGATSKNLDLCRCRVWNMASFISRQGIINRGYWSIPAGEFRLRESSPDDSAEDDPEIEAEEEEEARRLGDAGLARQRRLLVVTVKPLQQVTGDTSQTNLNEVVEALAGRGLLPANYDNRSSKPVPFDPTDKNNPCPSARKSIKAKIETLLERLLHPGK